MKKIIQEGVSIPEQVEYFCDIYPEKTAYNTLRIEGNYGSDFDLTIYRLDLSNEAAAEILEFIKSKLPTKEFSNIQKFNHHVF